ncbi:hypothetical protein AVEN_111874-1 [Araneus ventricosus]|uniref:Uncharacterized protein n=1 Tax=Araneus ventricosus TaxID=182803 RepID=A0A4Y2BZ23_ARAVE|nr:hypothetical protein AVEN_111874-1 [Araneus ventricosus]
MTFSQNSSKSSDKHLKTDFTAKNNWNRCPLKVFFNPSTFGNRKGKDSACYGCGIKGYSLDLAVRASSVMKENNGGGKNSRMFGLD